MNERTAYTNDYDGFMDFLKNNEFHEEFDLEYNKSDWNDGEVKDFTDQVDPEYFVSSAFDWDESDAGYDFWEDVDYVWNSNLSMLE